MAEEISILDQAWDIRRIRGLIEDEKTVWDKHSIYKLPAYITRLSENSYRPWVISFGPYHYGQADVQRMESHKQRTLLRFLARSRKSMSDYIDHLMRTAVDELMAAYDSLDGKWEKDPKAFLKMMMRDGCFMLELLKPLSKKRMSPQSDMDSGNYEYYDDYAPNDPIFNYHGRVNLIHDFKRDMLMLENQLPMLLLTELLYLEGQEEFQDDGINKSIYEFFFSPRFFKYCQMGKCLHVLDVYRKIILGDLRSKRRPFAPPYYSSEIIPSATELVEIGVKIKTTKSKSIRDVSFTKRGILSSVLYLPSIFVDDATEALLLNLISYEKFHPEIGNDVTSYVAFIADLIDTPKDVDILNDCGIIYNAYGTSKSVAKLFNSTSMDLAHNPYGSLYHVRWDTIDHCRTCQSLWRRDLVRSYFKNPWTVIALIAAIFAFTLNILGTVYTIGQFYQEQQGKSNRN